jgi:DNA-binding PucR family transcriptional regulator
VATDDHLADLIVHGDESVLDELALRRLGPLDALPGRVRDRLSETLLAWLEHHGRLREVADALYVHPQTVRYRVGQLRDALGDDLDDPRTRFELELALRGRRDGVQGHAATEPAEVDGLGSTAEPSTAARLSESGPAGAGAR